MLQICSVFFRGLCFIVYVWIFIAILWDFVGVCLRAQQFLCIYRHLGLLPEGDVSAIPRENSKRVGIILVETHFWVFARNFPDHIGLRCLDFG